jgi:hypothetical protein
LARHRRHHAIAGRRGSGQLKRFDDPVIATLTLADGGYVEVAFPRKDSTLVLGPYGPNGGATSDVPPDLTQADLTLAAAS